MRRPRPASLALCLAAVSASTASGQLVNFRHYTGAEGLPQSQVIGIMQDHDGYMWFATYGGLSRFNGHEFRTWSKRDGMASNSVFDAVQDASGGIVLATSGGLCTMRAGAFICRGERDGLVHDDIRSVTLDPQGGVWASTGRGISHVVGESVRNYTVASGLPADRVARVAIDRNERVWAATGRGLARLDGDAFVQVGRELIGDSAVQVVLPFGDGLLVGSQGRLFVVSGDLVAPYDRATLPENTMLVDGAIAPNGTIWLGTRDGALRINGSQVDHIAIGNALMSQLVLRVFLDRENNVWFGTENGASKHVPGPFRTYTVNDGLPNPFVRAIEVDADGRLWTGGRNGLAVRDGNRFQPVPLPGAPDSRIYALSAVPAGGLLIGTRIGLVWLRDGQTQVYREADGLPGDIVFSIVQDGAGGAWLGTDRGLAHWRDGQVRTVAVPGLPEVTIMAMTRDRRNRLWLGLTTGGIAIRDGESLRIINADSGATDQTIWSMAEDTRGQMWVGTNGDGVLRITDAEIRPFTTRDGLASDFIWQVLGDTNGDVWVFGNLGINRFSGDQWKHYGRGSGLIELEGAANAAKQDGNGNRWFGTGAGLVRYTPGDEVAPANGPTVYIESVTLNDELVVSTGTKHPRFDRGEVKFQFSSPSYRDENATSFSYRLVGLNNTWSKPTPDRSLTYAGLSGGVYTFEVRAVNGDLVSATPAVMTFEVMPPVWQTWWFLTLGMLVLASGGAAAPVIRARTLERERKRLEALVGTHTRELAEKNLRLQQSNRDLEHFAYIASHDLQEPLRKIQAFSDRVTKRYSATLDDQGRDYLSRMSGAASRMQRLIDDLLSLSRVTTKRNRVTSVDLNLLAAEVLGDLEFRVQSTNGRVEVDPLPNIVADPVQIRQIFQNLIGNALKFHRPDVPPLVRVAVVQLDAHRIELRFSDNGIGIAPDDAERIFLPFHRLHGRTQYEGTGIGLTICQKIADRHGGTIRAEGHPGTGTCFIVTLPIKGPSGELEHAA